MKKLIAIVILISLSNICLCDALKKRLTSADKTITNLKKEIKTGNRSFICKGDWCCGARCKPGK